MIILSHGGGSLMQGGQQSPKFAFGAFCGTQPTTPQLTLSHLFRVMDIADAVQTQTARKNKRSLI